MNQRIGIVLGFCCAGACAQLLTITSPQPVAPGATYFVDVLNNTGGNLYIPSLPIFAHLQPSGELVDPLQPYCTDVIRYSAYPPGQRLTASLVAPASPGSYLLLFHVRVVGNYRAVARLDVGTPSPGYPDIHPYPDAIPHPRISHQISFPPLQSPDWSLTNTGPAPHVFGAGDRIDVFAPQSTVPVATLPLQRTMVPAGGAATVSLPLAGLAPGPFTVETRWFDPGTTTTMTVRHGIRNAWSIDMHFPAGRVLSPGGAISVFLGTWDAVAYGYAFALGLTPGTTILPGGVVAPIVLDPLVARSVLDGLGGLLTANVGTMTRTSCGQGSDTYAAGLGLRHPGSPALAGVVLRAASIAWTFDRSSFVASQPEEILLR